MAFQFNGSQANVTLNQSQLQHTTTLIYGKQTGAGTTTLATVPAGHVYKIISIAASCATGTDNTVRTSQVQLNGVCALELQASSTATYQANVQNTVYFGYDCALSVAAANTITVVCTGGFGSASVVYVDELI